MANKKLSQITAASRAHNSTDLLVGIDSGNNDLLFPGGSPTTGYINVADYVTLVGDGVTDNYLQWNAWEEIGKTIGTPTLPVVVTISIGSPAVITWAFHGLRLNAAVKFSTTGALPTGITAGTVYYVISEGMTRDTFSISATNYYIENAGTLSFSHLNGEGTPIISSGSQSGVHKISILDDTWQNLLIPPGLYNAGGTFTRGPASANQKRVRINAYGVVVDKLLFSTFHIGISNFWEQNVWAYIDTVNASSTTVTVTTLADIDLFVPNQWLCFGGLEQQGTYASNAGYPPNNYYVEFRRIVSINTGTGVITLDEPLRNTYKSTWPNFFGGTAASGHETGEISNGGKAIIWGMNSDWDKDIEILGIEYADDAGQQTLSSARCVRWKDCIVNGSVGFTPSVNKNIVIENCRAQYGPTNGEARIEVDKLIENMVIRDSSFPQGILLFQSSAPNYALIENSDFELVSGTPKNAEFRGCDISAMTVGPLGFGVTESLTMSNCRVGNFTRSDQLTDQLISSLNQKQCLHNFTFSSGTLKQPIATTVAHAWAIPGRNMYINDMLAAFVSKGAPFQVLDVYESAGDFCVDTTLTAMPVGNSTSSTVTITIASPGVVSWTTHGLANGTSIVLETTGAVPTGLSSGGVVYYIVNAAANTFQLSATVGGSAINTTGSQSGVHTAFSNPLHLAVNPCNKMTIINCTGCRAIEDISNGPPNVPMFSYGKRRLIGFIETNTIFQRKMIVMGNLVSMTVNVLRAYSGATTPYTLAITSNAFNSSLIASNMTQTIDLKTAGIRVITPAGVTGSAGVDSISAFGNWLSGDGVTFLASASPSEALTSEPIVDIEIVTNQGFGPAVITYYGPTQTHSEIIAGTTPGVVL